MIRNGVSFGEEYASQLKQRLGECKAWLDASAYQLRSAVLEPPILDMQPASEKYNWLTKPSASAIVDGLADLRGALVRARNLQPLDRPHPTAGGRLLLSAPQMGFLDGNTSAVTGGYIDVYDAPPWDTWLDVVQGTDIPDYYDTFLVAWVPTALVALVDAGIRTSPAGFLAWASEVESTYTRQLGVASLL